MSGKINHAPGPWKTSLTDDTMVVDAAGREVAAIVGDYNDPGTWPLMEAHARLIAALPDFLKALQTIANGDGCYGAQAHEYKQIARDAIAKAS